MDIVDTRADLVSISVVLEGLEQLHVALRRLNGNDIGVQTLDGWEDIIEVGVAEVGVGLGCVGNTSSGETEGVNGPGEVVIPISATKRELKSKLLSADRDRQYRCDPHTPSRIAGSST